MNYHNKKFRAIQNTSNGETSEHTIFLYQQEGAILTAEYFGGNIVKGHLMGLVDEAGNIEMSYHHINRVGELMTGVCHSTPEVLPNGKIRLHEKWAWTSGDGSKGQSIVEEVDLD